MEIKEVIHNIQYSTVNKNTKYSTVQLMDIVENLVDVIPNDGYYPFYERQLKSLGYDRFMGLVNKARAGSDTPARLFCWMLKNEKLVK